MFRKAFTLIELLVVIAIIAILAAILFPVFAQAKAAAKGVASLSNMKQLTLASIMYTNDVDDTLIPVGTWHSSDPDNFDGWASWALLQDPYQKNFGINGSPVAGPIVQNSEIPRRSGTRFMDYGYNYTNLSPSMFAAGWPAPITTLSSTSVTKPAQTVYFTDRAGRESYGSTIYWYGANTAWMIVGLAEEPDCEWDPNFWCTDGWGTGSFYDTYVNDVQDGQALGGVAPRNTGGVNTSFVDGHTKKLQPGALAAGTNWAPGIASGSIKVTDTTKFLWATTN